MLKFMRNKIVGVERRDEQTFLAHGALDDEIYAMRLEVEFRLPELEIAAIKGWLDRYTTPECPAADDFLQLALGLRLNDPEFGRKVHKTIWRKSCQHYANLLLDCAASVRRAAAQAGVEARPAQAPDHQEKQAAAPKPPAPTASQPAGAGPKLEAHAVKGQGFVMDLHLHSWPASPCSSASVDELIQEAKRIGLNGVCLTDHNHVWDRSQVESLGRRHGLLVLAGNEITTDQGDILVFGLDKDIQGIIKAEDLRIQVEAAGGFMIAVHPFRGFLTFGIGKLGLSAEKARQRPLFGLVDAVEIRNGKVTQEENAFTEEVARGLDLAVCGGSDAHEVAEVGLFATSFIRPIKDERDLIKALKQGGHQVVGFRNQ